MFKELDPLLHSQLRLAVMSLLLSSEEEADFVFLREKTGVDAFDAYVKVLQGYIKK